MLTRRRFSPLLAVILMRAGTARADARQATPASSPVVVGPEFAERVDIGGRDLFLHCTGEGSPTVILEAGFGDTSGIWDKVQPEVARTTRVCSYDRAGLGQSDPPPTDVRTFGEVVADLHALLAAAGVPAPYVLVGNSIGGLFIRLYAGTYPEEIAGLVLVDGVPPGSAHAEVLAAGPGTIRHGGGGGAGGCRPGAARAGGGAGSDAGRLFCTVDRAGAKTGC